jgi:hypothetical protein
MMTETLPEVNAAYAAAVSALEVIEKDMPEETPNES